MVLLDLAEHLVLLLERLPLGLGLLAALGTNHFEPMEMIEYARTQKGGLEKERWGLLYWPMYCNFPNGGDGGAIVFRGRQGGGLPS